MIFRSEKFSKFLNLFYLTNEKVQLILLVENDLSTYNK